MNTAFRRAKALILSTPVGAAGLAIVLLYALVALFAPALAPHPPIKAFADNVLAAPDAQFWFGTDGNGMDVFSRILYGARYAFGISIPVLAIGMICGVPIGLIAGYRGGWVDETSTRRSTPETGICCLPRWSATPTIRDRRSI